MTRRPQPRHFYVGQCVEERDTRRTGRIVTIYRDPEIIGVLFDGQRVTLAISRENLIPIGSQNRRYTP